MVNLASFGYQSPATAQSTLSDDSVGSQPSFTNSFSAVAAQPDSARNLFLEENGITDINQFSSLARGFQTGLGLRPTNESESSANTSAANSTTAFNATDTGTRESFTKEGWDNWVGKANEAEAATTSGSGSDTTYQPTEDRSVAVEKSAPSAEMINLAAYQGLISKGFSHDQIYDAQTRFGVTNEEMYHNVNEGKGLVPENEQAVREALVQSQEQARDFAQSMKVDEKEIANNSKDGVRATAAGIEATAGLVRMI